MDLDLIAGTWIAAREQFDCLLYQGAGPGRRVQYRNSAADYISLDGPDDAVAGASDDDDDDDEVVCGLNSMMMGKY